MKKGQRSWTGEELILTINLYSKLPFGRLHNRNPEVVKLAALIGRTPSSVAYKLVNFASLDPTLKARGIKGAANVSKQDRQVWFEFYENIDVLAFASESLLAKFEKTTVEKLNDIPEVELPREGKTRDAIVRVRVNQSFFRKLILASYNETCCITGIRQRALLVAAHIKPWAVDTRNRLNPNNGLALNALHDKAFESGLITINEDFRVQVSSTLKRQSKVKTVRDFFLRFDDKPIIPPSRFFPSVIFLRYHHNERFII
jgi:putative restriction endonuclease